MSFRPRDHALTLSPPQPQSLPLLRPMEVGELLDEAFDLYKRNFRLFFSIAILLALPIGALAVAAPDTTSWVLLVNGVNVVATLITTGALIHAALERFLGRPTTLMAAYRVGMRRSLKMVVGWLIASLATGVGLLLLVIPGLLVALWSLLMAPIVVVENRGGLAALERGRKLASGHLWRLFFVGIGMLFVILIFLLVLVTLGGLVAALTGTDPSAPSDHTNALTILVGALVMLVTVLFQSAWTPVLAAAQLLMYLDLRIRREAYDVDLLVAALEARQSAEKSAATAGVSALGWPGG